MNKRAFGLSLSVVLLTCMPMGVQADDGDFLFEKGDIYGTPMAGAIFFLDDSNVDLKTSFIVGGRIGYFIGDHISLEGDFDYSWTEFNGPPPSIAYDGLNANNYYTLVNALYNFDPIAENLSPYLMAGIGWNALRAGFGIQEDGFAGQVGAGLHYGLSKYFLLRPEIRYMGVTNPGSHNLIASLGLAFKVPRYEEPPPPPAPVWRDSDEDGVPDHLDLCPNTPKGCIVDAEGCPLDSDKDGVCDGLDECPDTPLGVKVDEKGCPIIEKVTISWAEGLTFALGSAELSDRAKTALNEVIERAAKVPKVVVEIGGYTDSTGSAVFNQRLSEKRAISVRNYLVLKGVTPDRLIPIGYGETNFVADNATPEGRERNRRVEFKFLGEDALGLPLLHFKVGKSELTDQSMADLNGIAEKLKANPTVRVQIAAYTDSSGSAELNKRLSLKRANAVKDMLVAKGVTPENLKAVGRGATNFLTTNATQEGREMNRRVEFTIFWR